MQRFIRVGRGVFHHDFLAIRGELAYGGLTVYLLKKIQPYPFIEYKIQKAFYHIEVAHCWYVGFQIFTDEVSSIFRGRLGHFQEWKNHKSVAALKFLFGGSKADLPDRQVMIEDILKCELDALNDRFLKVHI